MRVVFGSSLKGPSRFEWTHTTVTKEEETHGDMVNAAALMLFPSPQMSDTKLIAALREKGYKGKNDKLRKIIARARELLTASHAAPAAKPERVGKKAKTGT